MRIWLIKISEPLPTDGNNIRLMRIGLLAEYLANQGHEVTWWTSCFNHQTKSVRFDKFTELQIKDNYKLILLPGKSYKKNLSLARLINHKQIAKYFSNACQNYSIPDIIFCCYPTIELSLMAVKYGLFHKIPVIIDIRDQWPDLIVQHFNKFCRPILRLMLHNMFEKQKKIFANATVITGITQEFVIWGTNKVKRELSSLDRAMPLTYLQTNYTIDEKKLAMKKIATFSFAKDDFIICFAGTISYQFDFDTVIKASKLLDDKRIKIVLAGQGDLYEQLIIKTKDCPNVILTNWLNQAELTSILEISSIGLAPYMNKSNFLNNIPNKIAEYIAHGLPILTCLSGKVEDLLKTHNIGINYEYKNPHDLANKINYLRQHEDLRLKLSHNALTTYKANFDSNAIHQKMENYITEIIGVSAKDHA